MRRLLVLLVTVLSFTASSGLIHAPMASADISSSVLVTTSACTQDVSETGSVDVARNACTSPLPNATVGLSFPEGGTQTSVTGGNGTTTFNPTIEGPYVLIPPFGMNGFPGSFGYCVIINRTGGGRTSTPEILNGEIPFNLSNDQDALCEILMFPQAGTGNPPPATEPARSFFHTIGCTSDMSNTVDFAVVQANCPDVVGGIGLSITDEAGTTTDLGTDQSGNLVSTAPKRGSNLLRISPFPPFTDGWVFCTELNPAGDVVRPTLVHPVSSAGVPFTISEEGNRIQCQIFFYTKNPTMPDGLQGTVLLCDANFDGLDANTLTDPIIAANCPLLGTGLNITLTEPNGTARQTTTGSDSSWRFAGPLTSGSQSLTADGPAGHTKLAILCNETTTFGEFIAGPSYSQADANGNVTIPVENSESAVVCRAFLYNPDGNKPGTTTTPSTTAEIRVAARTCPDGFTSTNFDQLDATCGNPDGPVAFTASGPTTLNSTSTGGENATFPDLAPSAWALTEATPDGFGQPVVFCALRPGGSTDIAPNIRLAVSDGTSITQELGAGDLMLCTWFNTTDPVTQGTVDPGTNGGGNTGSNQSTNLATLTITLLTCPAGYNPDTAKADPEKDCTELTDNVNISATDSKNQKKRRQTGENEPGVAVYEGLESGVYRLHEGYPDGVERAFIHNCTSDERELEHLFIPIARIDETGSIKIEIQAPEKLECTWFNIPTEQSPEDTENDDAQEGDQQGNEAAEPILVVVSIQVSECPGVPNPATCDASTQGVGVSLRPTFSNDPPIDGETNEDGIATIELIPGTYQIDADQSPCFLKTDFSDDEGNLVVVEGEAITAELFICSDD